MTVLGDTVMQHQSGVLYELYNSQHWSCKALFNPKTSFHIQNRPF